ncbi:MAG: MoaD/ThiS family protein [Bacteroidetes bacterium]|nr:MoaD/ThiS family protein [Fibrella sp.]
MNQPVSVLLFGITRELVGQSKLTCPLPPGASVGDLLDVLRTDYPRLGEIKSLLVAVNNEYADLDTRITSADEIALIPPVSGG